MTPTAKMRTNVALAALTGLMLRVFFVLKFPVTDSGDSAFYIELAWNWLKNGVYGSPVNGQLAPLDMRVPGYPAFLAAVFAFAGNSPRAVMVAQAVVDVACCFLIAWIASRLAPAESRRRVAIAALWLAALCPLTANYTAVVLTETLAVFLTALAILVLLETDLGRPVEIGNTPLATNRWLLAGIVVGFGALVRPETPLLLVAAGMVLVARWWRPRDLPKLVRACVLMGLGLLLPLAPWATRNWRTLHEVQFLAPRYLAQPGDYVPVGFNAWTNTWLWRFRDVYRTQWKVGDKEIPIDDVPASAFDSPEERERVAGLLEQYNDSLTIDPAIDQQFQQVARDRTMRHPLRTYFEVPFLRGVSMWLTPRTELLPYSGHLFPIRIQWEDDPRDFSVTVSLAAAGYLYVGLALAGAWKARRQPGWSLLIVFVLVRTAFFATLIETPEPRYVLECFPAAIALAAQVFSRKRQLSSTGSG
ncbi:MAG: glycosyltransferase family 39 protein [Candidatus Acidiferrales bacterium]